MRRRLSGVAEGARPSWRPGVERRPSVRPSETPGVDLVDEADARGDAEPCEQGRGGLPAGRREGAGIVSARVRGPSARPWHECADRAPCRARHPIAISTSTSPPAAVTSAIRAASAAVRRPSRPAASRARPGGASRAPGGELAGGCAGGWLRASDHDQSAAPARAEMERIALGGSRRVDGRKGVGEAGTADVEDRRRRQAAPERCPVEILLLLCIADGDDIAQCGHARKGGPQGSPAPHAAGAGWSAAARRLRREPSVKSALVGVLAMPDLRFLQRSIVDAARDRRPWSVPVAGKAGAQIPNADPTRAFKAASTAAVSAAGCPRRVKSIFLKSTRSRRHQPTD